MENLSSHFLTAKSGKNFSKFQQKIFSKISPHVKSRNMLHSPKACAKENEETMWLMWRSVLLQLIDIYQVIVLLL